MKLNPFVYTFLLVLAVVVQLPAQQSEADRKLFEEIKADAEKGDAIAQYNLGWCYDHGKGVPQDYAEAVKWSRKAADQGMADAQCFLGMSYAVGDGVKQDNAEAAKWYRKAADQGDARAQCGLGNFYIIGQGVEKNYAEGVKLLSKSANQGIDEAQYILAGCYIFGAGVSQDYTEANNWYRKAAIQGNTKAQTCLGWYYYKGLGVSQDYVAAYKWLNLAAGKGDTKAITYRNEIVRFMTPEQMAEGQQLTREFRPRKEGSANSASPANPIVTGTGFFITADGYLISNNHVIKDATQVRLVTSAGLISAKVVSVDAANDLALLKANGKFSPLPIAASRAVKLGNTVASVGFPNIGLQGFSPKLAKGEIASLSGAADDPRYFQISVPVQPGNSGGALVDERGNVIGIVSAKLDASAALAASGALPENVNYAVKSSFLLSFLESVPDVANKLKAPVTVDRKFEDVVKSAQEAAVLVLVY